MHQDLLYLTYVTALTGLMWVPYILDRIATRGLFVAVGYGDPGKPQSPWAARLMKAHANAIENLVVFGLLVLAARAMGLVEATIAMACIVYFWARIVHVVAFTFAIPWVRTLAFFVGFCAQAVVAWQIVMHAGA